AESFGGARFVEFAFTQRVIYLTPLDQSLCATAYFGKRAAEIEALEQSVLLSRRVIGRRFDVEIDGCNLGPAREYTRSLDTILELSHVTRPTVLLKHQSRFVC